MKKKLLVLLMTTIVAAGSITACGSKTAETTAAETTAAEAATTAAEADTTAAEAESAGDFAADFDTYLSWTGKEWSGASNTDKENAALAYSLYLVEKISGEELDKEEMSAELDKIRGTSQLTDLVNQLDANFSSADISLKEFVDMAAEQMANLTSGAAN